MACQCCKHISQSLGNGSIAVGTHYGVVVFGMNKGKGYVRGNVQHMFAPIFEHGKCDALALVWVVKLSDVKLRPLQHGSLVCGKCSSSTHAVYSLVRKALCGRELKEWKSSYNKDASSVFLSHPQLPRSTHFP